MVLSTFQSSADADPTAHGGSWSCRVCRDGGAFYSLQFYRAETTAGRRYHARAWVRRPADATSVAVTIVLRIRDGSDVQLDAVESEGVATNDDWQPIDIEATLPAETQLVESYVYAMPPLSEATTCFLVDDLALWLVP